MQRVVVVGCSGSGKTTFARRLAVDLDVPHLEMDSVMHRDGWNATPDEEFGAILDEFASQQEWVMDGNYTSHGAREAVWPRADTVIWLDISKRAVMRQVIVRSLRRVVGRELMWDSVREEWANLLNPDPNENIVLWAWTRFDHVRDKYTKSSTDGSWSHAKLFRLRSRSEADSFLRSTDQRVI